MKIKNNTKNLIPRKLIGGLVPKYLNSGFLSRVWNNAKKRTRNDILGKHGIVGRILAMPGELVRGLVTEPILVANTTTTTLSNLIPVNVGNVEIPIPVDKPTTQNPGTQGKPAGTRGNGSRGGTRGRKGNARTTAKPATTTFTDSPTNITDQGWLDARNAAMRRGWGTYNYNGLTYRFTGDEFLQAKRNWNNRRKAGYQAEGIINLPSINVPDNLIFDNNYARKIESTVSLTKPVDTKTTPMTYWYQRGTLAKNPEITREALWLATQDVRNGKRDASYYGESSNLVSQLANANQDSAKNYIYNLWDTDNGVATQTGRKNYTESQGLIFEEPTTNNVNKDSLLSWATDFLKRSARQGAKLISRK